MKTSAGAQYLEDLATGYWFSEALFTAVELEMFTLLDPKSLTADELARALEMPVSGLRRFLQALCSLDLLVWDGQGYFNTKLASDYLVIGKSNYQGDSILWRKALRPGWHDFAACLKAGGRVHFPAEDEDSELFNRRIRKYIKAMDNVARTKVEEILPFFAGLELAGELLDVGAGSGGIAAGFLESFPSLKATLLDIEAVLNYTQELLNEKSFGKRISYVPTNVLEPWAIAKEGFNLVILSNIIHAYSQDEITLLLEQAARCLKPDGFLVIHDFFSEHFPEKAAMLDLNMFINTYNGQVFSQAWIREQLVLAKLYTTELIPLETDTGLIFAAKDAAILDTLCLDVKTRLIARVKNMKFERVLSISAADIQVSDWTDLRCEYGCNRYGHPHCPPNSPSPQKTRDVLKDFSQALLLEGEPPGKTFQRQVLAAEREAFLAGFHKAFAYWAGPCVLCDTCAASVPNGKCRNTREARPAMEGAGIDVFETVRRAGLNLQTLCNKGDYVRYFALLLLE